MEDTIDNENKSDFEEELDKISCDERFIKVDIEELKGKLFIKDRELLDSRKKTFDLMIYELLGKYNLENADYTRYADELWEQILVKRVYTSRFAIVIAHGPKEMRRAVAERRIQFYVDDVKDYCIRMYRQKL